MSLSDLLLLLLVLGLFLLYQWVYPHPPSTITVRGEAYTTATPTEALLDLSVSKINSDSKLAQEEGIHATNDLIQALNLPSQDIQTLDYSLAPETTFNKDTGETKRIGYKFEQTVRIRVKNIASLPHFLQVGNEKADSVGNLQWQLDTVTREKQELETQRLAVQDAQTKAENMLQPLNERVGRVLSIQVENNQVMPIFASKRAMLADEGFAAPAVEPGETKITSVVTVVFELQTPWRWMQSR